MIVEGVSIHRCNSSLYTHAFNIASASQLVLNYTIGLLLFLSKEILLYLQCSFTFSFAAFPPLRCFTLPTVVTKDAAVTPSTDGNFLLTSYTIVSLNHVMRLDEICTNIMMSKILENSGLPIDFFNCWLKGMLSM